MAIKLYNRELSWLSFNQRVLQEAQNPDVPIYERIKFLAIFSSNLDEFFRVRVASLRSLLILKEKSQKELDFDPHKLIITLHNKVVKLQEEYGNIFRNGIIPELEKNGITFVNDKQVTPSQKEYLTAYFNDNIVPHIMPMILVKQKFTTFLRNNRLYLAVRLLPKGLKNEVVKVDKIKRYRYAIVEIPTNHLPRFVRLPKEGDKRCVIFLDDIIRLNLPQIFFGYKTRESYAIKLTRDAELYIEDEFSGNLLDKIKKSLSKRSTGAPSRFLYDKEMPASFLKYIRDILDLSKEDLYPGAKYHNFSDFFNFPVTKPNELVYKDIIPLRAKEFDKYPNIFEATKEKEFLLYYPYHTYEYIINALQQAANDPDVTSIKITQYRVAKNSAIVNALIQAAQNGKDVTAFVEVKARFDEEVNIQSAELMESAGVKVLYSLPGLKVHAKVAMITRKEGEQLKNYCYFSTGNFNEKTARLYTDFGFFTADERLTREASQVFEFLEGKVKEMEFNHLLVAQFNMRKTFANLVDNEIKNALNGKDAAITVKMNSLEDERMIKKLYEADNAGVKINLIIRGICCLVPGLKGISEHINAISIVDKFLEHGRVFVFHNNGDELIYLSSADWMRRNLSRRVEVAFPIYDKSLQKVIKDILAIQLSDNVKARIINEKQNNPFKDGNPVKIHSQWEIYNYISGLN